MPRLSRSGAAALAAFGLLLAACTSSTNPTGNVSPEGSPSASASASQAASPSASASPTSSGPLAITAVPVHNGEIGQPFGAITLTAEGGLQPYSWAVGTGALPPGLAMSVDGVISGQVTKDGTFKFTVAVADSGGGQASQAASITVFKALKLTATCAQLCIIGKGCAKCGGFGSVSGGQTPYAYQITGGAVPPGMSLSGLSLKGGFPAGAFALSVQVTDKFGVKGTVAANWNIYTAGTLSPGGDCVDASGNGCSTTWSYFGGSPGTPPQVVVQKIGQYCSTFCYPVPTGLPPGWTVKVGGGSVVFSTAGIACNTPGYAAVITLALKDQSQCATTALSASQNLIVNIYNGC